MDNLIKNIFKLSNDFVRYPYSLSDFVFKGTLQFVIPIVYEVSFDIPTLAISVSLIKSLCTSAEVNHNIAVAYSYLNVARNFSSYNFSTSLRFLKEITTSCYRVAKLKDKNYIIGDGNIFTEDGEPYFMPFYRLKLRKDNLPLATGIGIKLSDKILMGTDMLDKYIKNKFIPRLLSFKNIPIPLMKGYRRVDPIVHSTSFYKSGDDARDIEYRIPTNDIRIVYEDLSKYNVHPKYPTIQDNDASIHDVLANNFEKILFD